MTINRSSTYGNDLRRFGAFSEVLKVSALDDPNLTVKINRGGFWKNEAVWVETTDVTTQTLPAPSSGARYYLVCLRDTGLVSAVPGPVASSNPALPTVPAGYLPLAAVYVPAGTTKITNDLIIDVRPWFRAGVATKNHNELAQRNAADAHEMSAITGLVSALDAKLDAADVNSLLAGKADTIGTDSNTFTLNKDATGVATENAAIMIHRGSQASVGLRFNESTDVWEYTNDGATWVSFSSPTVANGSVSYSSLEANLQDLIDEKAEASHIHDDRYYTQTQTDGFLNGKAAAVHNHDDRYYTETEMTALLATKAPSAHTHAATDITSGTLNAARLPTNINANLIADGTVSNAEFQYLANLDDDIQDQLNGKAASSHTHSAVDITSGTLNEARLPTSINANKIADGTVGNTTFQRIAGLTSDAQTQLNSKSAVGHVHAGTDITTGTISADRLPSNISAGLIADGTVSNTEFQYVNGVTSAIQTQLDAKAALVGTADIEITSSAAGVILRSPDSTRWRLTVDDAGLLTTVEIV